MSTPQILLARSMSQSQPSYRKVLPAHSWGPFSHPCSCLPHAPLPQYHKKLVGVDASWSPSFIASTSYFFLFPPLMFSLLSYSCSHLNGCAYQDKYILPLTKSSFWSDLNFRFCLGYRREAGAESSVSSGEP